MDLEQISSEIEPIDICRFCNFWDISSIDTSEIKDAGNQAVVRVLRDTNICADRDDGNKLVVTEQQSGELRIPLAQLIYEIYAFTCLNDELSEKVSTDDFFVFIEKKIRILEEQGWEVAFADNPIFPALNNVNRKTCLNKNNGKYRKIFYIKYVNQSDPNEMILDGRKHWIKKIYLQEILRVYFMEVIVSDYREKLARVGVEVVPVNWVWGLNNCLYPKTGISSEDIEHRDKYIIGNLSRHIEEEHQFLLDVYGDRKDIDYYEMFDIPEKVMPQRGMLHHVDKSGKYVNVIAGRRQTTDSPEEFKNTVYMLGGCVFFGYAEEDCYTVASYLQRLLNTQSDKNWRVVNLATWGGNIDEEHEILKSLRYRPGDIVFISYAGLIPIGDDYSLNDISYKFAVGNDKIKYFNSLVHCNRYGYEMIARNILEKYKTLFNKNSEESEYIDAFPKDNADKGTEADLSTLYLDVKNKLPYVKDGIGAIVMNCNPFTYGHRYLIEKAAQNEEQVVVFVVEEDKSEFPFKDRIELVKKGTSDISNVLVVPSGAYMISSKTFPEYFTKKEKNTLDIDPSGDVFLFARVVAPYLNIKRRYIGEEPFDLVTKKYNQVMKEVLPTYGVKVIEIERKTDDEDEVISASYVRKCLRDKEWDKLMRIVPTTTYEYLRKEYCS